MMTFGDGADVTQEALASIGRTVVWPVTCHPGRFGAIQTTAGA
jgi:molybdopterin biosynthesis enzyme